jgi:hypothetical protein
MDVFGMNGMTWDSIGEAAAGGGEEPRPQPATDAASAVERSSNTQRLSSRIDAYGGLDEGTDSPSVTPFPGLTAVAAIDWIEVGGCAEFSPSREDRFFRLEEVMRAAREAKQEQPYALAGHSLNVFGTGMGTGRQARLPYRLEWAGVTLAFADRPAPKRNLYNVYIKIPGHACLLLGARQARDAAHAMLADLGGKLMDEWVRRIDLCLDIRGLDLRDELFPSFMEERFITNAVSWNPWMGKGGPTGFSIGRGGRTSLNVYDKLLDSLTRQPEDYRQAMIDRRWGGQLPAAATRIEYQIRKPWLDEYGYRDADTVLRDLGSIVWKLCGADARTLFRMTTEAVDREGKHQSRAETSPLWAWLMAEMVKGIGVPTRELKPIRRSAMCYERAYRAVRGYLAGVAAYRGVPCDDVEDAVEVFRTLEVTAQGTAEGWRRVWEDKARKAGTLDSVTSFP